MVKEERRTLKNRKRPKFELDEEVSEKLNPNFKSQYENYEPILAIFLWMIAKYIYCLIYY